MRTKRYWIIVGWAVFYCWIWGATTGFAGQAAKIQLNDGSVITGELLSLAGGLYTVKTRSLGTITIDESLVSRIDKGASSESVASAGAAGDANLAGLDSLKMQILGNQEIMGLILSLQNDPAVQKALQDPQFMNAVSRGDVNALSNDPLFQDILANPTVQEIQKKSLGK